MTRCLSRTIALASLLIAIAMPISAAEVTSPTDLVDIVLEWISEIEILGADEPPQAEIDDQDPPDDEAGGVLIPGG